MSKQLPPFDIIVGGIPSPEDDDQESMILALRNALRVVSGVGSRQDAEFVIDRLQRLGYEIVPSKQ